jgi:hypothetical protein
MNITELGYIVKDIRRHTGNYISVNIQISALANDTVKTEYSVYDSGTEDILRARSFSELIAILREFAPPAEELNLEEETPDA